MPDNPWLDRVRERLASEGLAPSAHREATEEIADHLGDLHREALAQGTSEREANSVVSHDSARSRPRSGNVRSAKRGCCRNTKTGERDSQPTSVMPFAPCGSSEASRPS